MLHSFNWASCCLCFVQTLGWCCLNIVSVTFQGYVSQLQAMYAAYQCPEPFVGYTTFANAFFAFSGTLPQVPWFYLYRNATSG